MEGEKMDKQKKSDRSKRPSLKSILLKLRDIMRERGLTKNELIEKYLVPKLSATTTIVAQERSPRRILRTWSRKA
jgi:hypothetical protein